MTSTVVEYEFAAAPAKVYRAWTDPDIVLKWFGHDPNSLHSASIDLREGGAWRFIEHEDARKSVGFEGEYLEVRAGQRLVFTWARVVAYAGGQRESSLHAVIEVDFEPQGEGTRVRLVHTLRDPTDSTEGIADGWTAALNSLRGVL